MRQEKEQDNVRIIKAKNKNKGGPQKKAGGAGEMSQKDESDNAVLLQFLEEIMFGGDGSPVQRKR
jgi:hypothetical protein